MRAQRKASSILDELVARACELGVSELEVEYKAGRERVFAVRGPVSSLITSFSSSSNEAKELRTELYAIQKKARIIETGSVSYKLKVRVFDSFGEDAFRIQIQEAKPPR